MSYAWRDSTISGNVTEGGNLGPYRNNYCYAKVGFQAPYNKVCCGSAYGSGLWWPDLGGFPGAPEQNRWRTPAESWFENHNKFRDDAKLRAKQKEAASRIGKPLRISEVQANAQYCLFII